LDFGLGIAEGCFVEKEEDLSSAEARMIEQKTMRPAGLPSFARAWDRT
jgi:hypothetical protein